MKKKIMISHEVPLCLLRESLKFNDYQYILPHLLDQNEVYKNFMLDCKKNGIYIMMDNSLHELGTPYSEERLLYWLETIQPNEFFIPDYWEDKTRSVVSAKKWISFQSNFPNTTFIAVVQALSYADAVECYQIYKDLGYNKIAFSYGASYYNKISNHPNKDLGKSLGRIEVISKLFQEKIISNSDRIHLLGCSTPQEFGWYKDMSYIESIDTSNPIMAAIDDMQYQDYGLYKKPKTKIDEVFEKNVFEYEPPLFKYNIDKFRTINNL